MSKIKLYYDLMSQPSRALYIFLSVNKIPFEKVNTEIINREHKTEFYQKNVHRFKKVPAIIHNDFNLTESIAIYRYLAREFKIPDNWYPKDSRKQARVDEYLEWQHLNTRWHCSAYFFQMFVRPLLGKSVDPDQLKETKKMMNATLDLIDKIWLDGTHQFLTGDQISVADIVAATEIMQTTVCNYDPFEGRQNLKKWLDAVRKETNPYFDETHKKLLNFVPVSKAKL